MSIVAIVALILVLTVSASGWFFWRLLESQAGVIQERLETYASRGIAAPVRRERRTIAVRLDRALRQRPFGQHIADELARADLQLRVSEYLSLCLLSGVMGILFGLLLFGTPVLALLSGVVGLFLPRIYLRRRQAARLKAFNDQLGDALRLIVSSLRSGYSMLQSMQVVASELPEPIGPEFGRVVREVGLGLSQEEALRNMLRRIQSDDLDMVVTAINVQHEVGGNLAEILETISDTISERVRIQGEIKVLTAQQMLSGYLLSALPFIVVLILFVINRSYISQLFQDTCGLFVAAVALLLVALGFLLIRKIVSIQV